MDDGCAVVLVLLDISATFDTVDYAVLISRLSARCVIKGKAFGIGLNVLIYRELRFTETDQHFVNTRG